MRQHEMERIFKAFNNLSAAEVEKKDFIGNALKVTKDDYEALKPFLRAWITKTCFVGDVEIKINGAITGGTLFEAEDEDGGHAYISVHDEIGKIEMLCNLKAIIEALDMMRYSIKSDKIYKEESWK